MIDLSVYLEEEFEAELKKTTSGKTIDTAEVKELTEEESVIVFHDFNKNKNFVGKFKGPGTTYTYQGNTIKTWSFEDQNGLNWLIPQWEAMDKEKEAFKGFKKEVPGENLYLIKYNGLITDSGKEPRHDISVFSKRI